MVEREVWRDRAAIVGGRYFGTDVALKVNELVFVDRLADRACSIAWLSFDRKCQTKQPKTDDQISSA